MSTLCTNKPTMLHINQKRDKVSHLNQCRMKQTFDAYFVGLANHLREKLLCFNYLRKFVCSKKVSELERESYKIPSLSFCEVCSSYSTFLSFRKYSLIS